MRAPEERDMHQARVTAVGRMADALGALQRDPEDPAALVDLLDNVRMLRRSANGCADGQIAELTAKLETVLHRARQGITSVDPRMLEALSASVELAADLVADEAPDPATSPAHAEAAETPATPSGTAGTPRRASVAVVGSGDRAAELLSLLADDDHVSVAAVCVPSPETALYRAALVAGVPMLFDLAGLSALGDVDLVIDASEDPETRPRLDALLAPDVQVVGPAAASLIGDLLGELAAVREEHETAEGVRAEIDQVRRRASQLQAGHEELARANASLNRELAETYFIHEFFKALSRAQDVDDVCSIAVDGAAGLLGAEVAAVYVAAAVEQRLVLRASQGRTDPAFVAALGLDSYLATTAMRAPVFSAEQGEGDAEWVREPLAWQMAIPLAAGREVLGILVFGGTQGREITSADEERAGVVAEQCALALQNALLHEDLEMLAVTDRMTGMYNHVYGVQRLDEEVKRAVRFDHQLSLIMLDIDDFKSFNDTWGHPAGDELLGEVGTVIRRALRDMDVAIRYGGEEFAIILPETPASGAALVAERIRNDVAEVTIGLSGGESVGRTVSLGVAEYPSDAASGRELVEAADRALYRAKRAGKNRVESA